MILYSNIPRGGSCVLFAPEVVLYELCIGKVWNNVSLQWNCILCECAKRCQLTIDIWHLLFLGGRDEGRCVHPGMREQWRGDMRRW